MRFHKLIATCLGIGYIQKGAGSVAALFCCFCWYAGGVYNWPLWIQGLGVALLFAAGVVAATAVEPLWGHDSNRVVIDEWMGMALVLVGLPFSWPWVALAFVLFRAFDIAKPLYIRKAERFGGGWGVMLDDLLAGVYSAVLLQLLRKSNLF